MKAISEAMLRYVEHMGLSELNGNSQTHLAGVHFYRAAQGSPRQPLLYQSGIIIIGQGRKVIHLGEHHVNYAAGEYLVLGVPLPLECEAYAEPGEAILSLSIDVPAVLLHELVHLLAGHKHSEQAAKHQLDCGIKSASYDEDFQHCCIRLLKALTDPCEALILGPGLIRELIYRVLVGPQGHTLFGLAQHDGHYARVAKVLTRVHKDYAKELSVEDLAAEANMSVSAFHRAFRQVTLESPLQYLKKVRLVKAKELISVSGKKASEAANLVGYTSPSQFSREFKRHFNHTPGQL